MDILFLLIPLSAVLVLAIIGVFGWALYRGQFEDLEHEGERILDAESPAVGPPTPAANDASDVSPASDGPADGGSRPVHAPSVDVDQVRR